MPQFKKKWESEVRLIKKKSIIKTFAWSSDPVNVGLYGLGSRKKKKRISLLFA